MTGSSSRLVGIANKSYLKGLRDCARLLSRPEKVKIATISLLQFSLSLLDLIGVGLIGVLSALAVNGIQSKSPGNRVQKILDFAHISNLNFSMQIIVIAVSASFFLILKTMLSVFFSRRTMFFLSNRASQLSSKLTGTLLKQDYLSIRKYPSQELLYAITGGVNAIFMGVIASITTLVTDLALLLMLSAGLIAIDIKVACLSMLTFSTVGYFLYWFQHSRATMLAREYSRLNVEGNSLILEVLASYKELIVRNRRNHYKDLITENRHAISRVQAEMTFMPLISKYVVEVTIVIASLLMCGFQLYTQDIGRAVGTLTIFMAAGTRIGPAVLRIQQGFVSIKSNIESAKPALILIEEYSHSSKSLNSISEKIEHFSNSKFDPTIEVNDVSIVYPDRDIPSIAAAKLNIKKGTSIAFVGPSGAGKTTLADAILGVISPTSGEIRIGGVSPQEAVMNWPGAIGYVPQDVLIIDGSIRENIALGYKVDEFTDSEYLEAARIAQLTEVVASSSRGLDAYIGERGTKLSGGQRQRLGIARALITNPKILVLDEATSALDGETETIFSEAIKSLKSEVTLIIIAHRLNTIQECDQVAYFKMGKILKVGTISEVRLSVPEFETQLDAAGL